MAIYHCSVKTISRSTGRSATAAGAYRAGGRIVDERTGEIHDYRKKRGVEHHEIIGADLDSAQLWNLAEASERRKNSTVAREIVVALPADLNQEQRRELAQEFAAHLVRRYGFAAQLDLHAPSDGGDDRNHHAHILATTRRFAGGELGEKTRELDGGKSGREQIEVIREDWEQCCNRHLVLAGVQARVDRRSLDAQGVDREPTIHLGPTATAMERRGAESDRGDVNRDIEARRELVDVNAELVAIEEENRGRMEKWRSGREGFGAAADAEKARQERDQEDEDESHRDGPGL
jgi:ATP-dependent exoDNAse (exonuclease V) alpha subunit